jgi:hypothetical protein
MNILASHAAISLALAAVLWVVQLVIYPAFRFIAPDRFADWHYRYTGAITWVVAPLILLQTAGVAARLLFLEHPDVLWLAECIFTTAAWAVTAFVSVPLHAMLQKKRDEQAMKKLVSSNWWRTAAWSLSAACSWTAANQAFVKACG